MTAAVQPALMELPPPEPVPLPPSLLSVPRFGAEMVRELAIEQKVCIRPQLRTVTDTLDGSQATVALPCGSTREAVCPPCAHKARVLRMQQCAEGWHLDHEPERRDRVGEDADEDSLDGDDRNEDDQDDDLGTASDDLGRRVRSTRRRDDAADLPRVPVEDRTVGRAFETPDGRVYRPSMFLTLTLPSYGAVRDGVPVHPGRYDYRRAALDALHFAKLLDRFWQNLRRCAGYRVQYFSTVEAQRRLTPHLHAAIRGAIPRQLLRQVVKATYVQLWWPAHDIAVYDNPDRLPAWDGADYVDQDTGLVLPTWRQALDRLGSKADGAVPAHVVRFGSQLDVAGILGGTEDADRAVRYLAKYLTKAVAETHADQAGPGYEQHVDRLHQELRFLPCSPRCANWLRYGVQPKNPGPGLRPGWCVSKAHDRDHLGVGGRRVLVSQNWSGKTLGQHRADRATVVREALLSAGVIAPEIERMAAEVKTPDGQQRYVWTEHRPDPLIYAAVILASIAERQRWREQYEAAKQAAAAGVDHPTGPVDSVSATGPPRTLAAESDHSSASPMTRQSLGRRSGGQG